LDLGLGHDLDAWHDLLVSAQELTHEGPAHVGGERGDAAAMPAVDPAIEAGRRRPAIVRVVDVGTAISGEDQLLADRRRRAQIPAQPRESALGILSVRPRQREAVELSREDAAKPGILE